MAHSAFHCNDPDGNRTRVTAVKGRCLNRLTTGPYCFRRENITQRQTIYYHKQAAFASIFFSSFSAFSPPARLRLDMSFPRFQPQSGRKHTVPLREYSILRGSPLPAGRFPCNQSNRQSGYSSQDARVFAFLQFISQQITVKAATPARAPALSRITSDS